MKVTLLTGSQKEIAVAGALGCTSVRPSAEILAELQAEQPAHRETKCKLVLKNSFGRGHGAVGDQAVFQFSISGITRLSTLFLCQSPYASFLQQSLRRVQAGDYKLPDTLQSKKYAKDVVERAFDLYTRMVAAGIPAEDARYILPLCTTTNIQMTVGVRELCHIINMANSKNMSSEAKMVINSITCSTMEAGDHSFFSDYGSNYEPLSFYPAPDLFAEEGPMFVDAGKYINSDDIYGKKESQVDMDSDELKKAIVDRNPSYLSLLKHIHFTFTFGMSLASFHQAVRQRTWDHTVETLSNAVGTALEIAAGKSSGRTIIPPSVLDSSFAQEFYLQHHKMLNTYHQSVNEGVPKSEAFNLLPHSLKIYDLVHINGWNAIHSLGKRTCSKAQWEIRGIADKASQIIKDQYPELGRYVGPQCMTYGYCPESKPCGRLKKVKEVTA